MEMARRSTYERFNIMCNFNYTVEVSKEEIETAMFIPGEYKIIDGKYYIPDIPGFRDGYICPCYTASIEGGQRPCIIGGYVPFKDDN